MDAGSRKTSPHLFQQLNKAVLTSGVHQHDDGSGFTRSSPPEMLPALPRNLLEPESIYHFRPVNQRRFIDAGHRVLGRHAYGGKFIRIRDLWQH